eukprot:9425431-Pyramimonas_sp.AAC.1
MLPNHADDLKIAGQKKHADLLISHIESVISQMKGDWKDFTNCGAHQSHAKDGAATLDQDEYIDARPLYQARRPGQGQGGSAGHQSAPGLIRISLGGSSLRATCTTPRGCARSRAAESQERAAHQTRNAAQLS